MITLISLIRKLVRLVGSKWFLRKGRGDYMFLVYEKNYNMDGDEVWNDIYS